MVSKSRYCKAKISQELKATICYFWFRTHIHHLTYGCYFTHPPPSVPQPDKTPTVGNSIHHHNEGKERTAPAHFTSLQLTFNELLSHRDQLLCVKSTHFSFMPSEEKWNIWNSLQGYHLKELLSTTILSNLRKKININIWNNCSLSCFVCLFVLLLFLFLALLCGLPDLSSLTRDWTWALTITRQVLNTGLAENSLLLVLVAYDKIKLGTA